MKADVDPKSGVLAPGVMGPRAAAASRTSILRSRLFVKYVALLVSVVVLALIANGAFEIWFSYQEHKASLIGVQREQARAAADKIEEFVTQIRKPGRLDHAAALVGRNAGTAALRCAAAFAPGARDHRARANRRFGTRAAQSIAAHYGRGRQRRRLLQQAGIYRGRGAQGLLRPGLFPPRIRALHDAVAGRHAARHRREHRASQSQADLGRGVEHQGRGLTAAPMWSMPAAG